MNICILAKTTLAHTMGGTEVHCKNLSIGLARRGCQVSVIATKHPQGIEYAEDEGVRTYYLKNTKSGVFTNSWWKESADKLKELNARQRFDLVLSECLSASGCVKLMQKEKIPYLPIMQGLTLQHIRSEFSQCNTVIDYCKYVFIKIPELFYYSFFFEEGFLKKADALIVVNKELADLAAKRYRIRKDKIFFIYNGIDVNLFKPDSEKRRSIRQKYNLKESDKVILMLGVVSRQKGFHLGIRAFCKVKKKIPAAKLMVVGDGPYLIELKKIAEKLSLLDEIIFSAEIKNEETHLYYNACDIFIFPTLRIEAMPFVLEEAMSCAKPVIATDIGGNSSAIDNGINGILIPPNNTKLLSAAIIRILNDEEFSKKLSSNSRAKAAANFSIEKMVEDIINVKNRL